MAISDFADMMTDTVTIAAESSKDAYGKPTYAAGTQYDARVNFRSRKVTNEDGQEEIARGEIWIMSNVVVATTDLVTLSTGDTPKVITTERFQDETADHHTKVYFR